MFQQIAMVAKVRDVQWNEEERGVDRQCSHGHGPTTVGKFDSSRCQSSCRRLPPSLHANFPRHPVRGSDTKIVPAPSILTEALESIDHGLHRDIIAQTLANSMG